jgi:hypothetical protein
MKTPILFSVAFLGLYAVGCDSKAPASVKDTSPFQTIIVRDGKVVGTLPAVPSWMVIDGSAEPRQVAPSESFSMKAGSSLVFAEQHSSYRVTAQLSPAQGLMIESEFDARSFGGELTKRKYFMPAKEAEQAVDGNSH